MDSILNTTPPPSPAAGDQWTDVHGRRFVWTLNSNDTGQWVQLPVAQPVSAQPMVAPPITNPTPKCTTSATPPLSPTPNDLWFDTTTGFFFIFYNDGNTYQWVVTNPGRGSDVVPPPSVAPVLLNSAPGVVLTPNPITGIGSIGADATWLSGHYLPITGGTMTGDLLVNSPAGAQVHLGNAWIDLMATTGGPGVDWQTFSAPVNQKNWQMYPDSGTANALLLAAANDAWTNVATWTFNRDGTTSFPNKVGIGTAAPLTYLDVHANVNGTVSMGWFVNDSTGASSRSTIVQEAGGRSVFRNVDRTGQYLHEVGNTIPTRYSDFDTHYFRNSAGVAQLTIAPTGVTLASALLGTTALFSGTITSTAAPGGVRVDGPVATNRTMGASTSGLLRWTWGANNAAESGSSAGSDFTLNTYSDAGAYASTPLIVTRSTGAAVFAATVQATRVGVGMAPSATATSTLWSVGDITLNGANHAYMANVYYDSGWKYTVGGATAGAIKMGVDTTTAYQLLVAPNNAGAAGAAATPVVAMTATGTGNVDLPGTVLTGGPSTARWQITANSFQIYGSGGVNNVFLQHDNTNAYLRPTNAGSVLLLGAANANIVNVAATGFWPSVTKTSTLGASFAVWNAFHTVSATFYGATSGTSTVQAPAVAGSTTLTLPSATGTLALTTDPGPPNGAAGGDLAGTYPNPTIKPSVTNGQVLTTVGGVAAWAPASGGGASISVSDTPPGSPTAGALWWNSVLGTMFIYFNDGNTSQWVPAAPSAATATSGVMRLYDEQVLAAPAAELRANIPLNAKAIELWFGLCANVAANETLNLFGLNGAAVITTLFYNLQGINNSTTSVTGVSVSGQAAWGIGSGNNFVGCVRLNNYAGTPSMTGNADFFTMDTGSIITKRQQSLTTSSAFNPTGFRFAFNSNNNFLPGSYMRTVVLT